MRARVCVAHHPALYDRLCGRHRWLRHPMLRYLHRPRSTCDAEATRSRVCSRHRVSVLCTRIPYAGMRLLLLTSYLKERRWHVHAHRYECYASTLLVASVCVRYDGLNATCISTYLLLSLRDTSCARHHPEWLVSLMLY